MTYNANPQERTARERYHDALFVIRDGDGRAHYFSRYHQAVVVIAPDGGVDYDLTLPVRADDGTEIHDAGDWLAHVRERAGVETHRIGGSLVDDLTRMVRP